MQITPFKLERYFAQYEFKVKYLLSPSDCESLSLSELLQLADSDSLALWSELRLGVRSNLTSQTLQAWLRDQLFVDSDAVHLQAALAALRTEGVLDEQNRPHTERLASLIDEWGLRAGVREASREDYG